MSTALEHFKTYIEGWTQGKADKSYSVLADDYTYDDPNSIIYTKETFTDLMNSFKEATLAACGGQLPDPFIKISEAMTEEIDGRLTAWCLWEIPGSELRGSALVKGDSVGIRSEVIAYYTKLP